MNYELAKSLKKAGFPQRGLDGKLYEIKEEYKNSEMVAEMQPTIPTLSELIEACGDNFFGLFKCDAHAGGGHCWKAEGAWERWMTNVKMTVVSADTSEEAVANLWLKLNSKNG